jgi:molybdopterin-guanine dinucleotide biosynthesis protein A
VASAAILRGGRASRFGGRDKGALLVGGRSIRSRQLDVLTAISDDILLVGGPIVEPTVARYVVDLRPGLGPLAGLEAALGAARDDTVVVVACDMPCLTAPFLKRLLAQAASADVVVPRTERGYHPLCAVYSRRCLPAIQRRLERGDLAVRGLFDEVVVCEVSGSALSSDGDPRQVLANVNTPAEYDELNALLSHEL